jgi:aryl-alcohol dehydrogenase-like predicted oxidoreductase
LGAVGRRSSRHHIIRAVVACLRRLGTDYIDRYQAHGWDGQTPLEEMLDTFDRLATSDKVRYIGASTFSVWHLMKAILLSDRRGLQRFAGQQIYCSLKDRDAESELIPISIDQGVGVLV